MATPPEGVRFEQIVVGDGHTAGIATDGSFRCWGENTRHQCPESQHDDTEYGATVDANGRHSGGPFYVEVSQKMTVQDLRKEIRVRRRRPPPARLLSPR